MQRTRSARVSAVAVALALVLVGACTSTTSEEGSDTTAVDDGTRSDGSGDGPPPSLLDGLETPESSADEPSGNFRTICEFSHLAYDDPIVSPGEPGASHLHMFFGNTEVDASSDYESLTRSGDSSCQGGVLNRSGYWAPAVIDADGRVVTPEFISVYYKGTGTADEVASVETLAPGLRMIAGYDEADGTSEWFEWYCETSQDKGPTIPTCPDGELVGVVLQFPSCWDGRNLDAPDHRSHMAYKERDVDSGAVACPPSHPVRLPEFTLGIWFAHEGDSDEWHLSSDRMPDGPEHPPGSTFHSDWFGGWDPEIQERWTVHCIRELRNCVDGELGDGTQLAGGVTYDGPHRVDPPTP